MTMQLEDIALLSFVSVLQVYQLGDRAWTVAICRRKHKIFPPEMDGPPELVRALRAQQNDLEFAIPFQVLLWICGIFFNQVTAAVLGIMYIYFRRKYALGYIEDPDKRVKPFHRSMNILVLLLTLSMAGIGNVLVKQYLQVDLAMIAKNRLFPLVGQKDEL